MLKYLLKSIADRNQLLCFAHLGFPLLIITTTANKESHWKGVKSLLSKAELKLHVFEGSTQLLLCISLFQLHYSEMIKTDYTAIWQPTVTVVLCSILLKQKKGKYVNKLKSFAWKGLESYLRIRDKRMKTCDKIYSFLSLIVPSVPSKSLRHTGLME